MNITERGFEWKIAANGSYANLTGTGTGNTFTANLSGLSAGTEYIYRAYVKYDATTVYGGEVSFTTESASTPDPTVISSTPCTVPSTHPAQTGSTYQNNGYNGANHGLETVNGQGEVTSVTDYDGNEYPVVQIGEGASAQCWMAVNLRTTRYADGGSIPYNQSASNTAPSYYNYSTSSMPLEQRGLLYNWPAVAYVAGTSNTNSSVMQGLCPVGWHVPSDEEWSIMESVACGSSWEEDYFTISGYRGNHAGLLAGDNSWTSNSIEGSPGDYSNLQRNSYGFGVLPAGYWYGSYTTSGTKGGFWSCTQASDNASLGRTFDYDNAGVNRDIIKKGVGRSVRCVRDENGNTAAAPTATTSPASNITQTSATLNGSVTNPDNVTVTAQGFEWKATTGGTYTTVNATGATMTYNLTGLTPNTSYTYRAFVTTASETTYGDWVTFTTLNGNVILSEDFSAITDSTQSTITYQLNYYTQMSGWTEDWVYPSAGKVRIGKSAQAGFIQTPSLDLSGNNGQFVVTFDAKAWNNNATSIIVSIND